MGDFPDEYFDWTHGRLAWAGSWYWDKIDFWDGSTWRRIVLGIYWRTDQPNRRGE